MTQSCSAHATESAPHGAPGLDGHRLTTSGRGRTRAVKPGLALGLTLAMALTALAGCGGGGSGDEGRTPPPPPPSSPSGPSAPPPPDSPPPGGSMPLTPALTLDELVAHASAAHELVPGDLPASLYWGARAALQQGNPAPAGAIGLGGFGQLFAAAAVPPNTRVELRNFETFVKLQSSGAWKRVQYSERVSGRFYPVGSLGATNVPAGLAPQEQVEGSGYVSVQPRSGFLYRFWPQGGIAAGQLDIRDVAGVFTTVQARLIAASAAQPDDRDSAQIALNTAADWWSAAPDPADRFAANPQVGNGRLLKLGKAWRAATFVSAPADTLRAAAPPLGNAAKGGATHATRVMVIGDSISQGSTAAVLSTNAEHPSFRRALWHTLIARADLPLVDFVGSRNGLANSDGSCAGSSQGERLSTELALPYANDYDGDHEAYFGSCTNEVTAQVAQHLQASALLTPDVALIHLGTNDLTQQQVGAGTVTARLADLIAQLRKANPAVKIVLSRIIPQAGTPDRAALNQAIAALGASSSTAASPVQVAAADNGFDASVGADTFDGTHPNDRGEVKLASSYAAQLAQLIK